MSGVILQSELLEDPFILNGSYLGEPMEHDESEEPPFAPLSSTEGDSRLLAGQESRNILESVILEGSEDEERDEEEGTFGEVVTEDQAIEQAFILEQAEIQDDLRRKLGIEVISRRIHSARLFTLSEAFGQKNLGVVKWGSMLYEAGTKKQFSFNGAKVMQKFQKIFKAFIP